MHQILKNKQFSTCDCQDICSNFKIYKEFCQSQGISNTLVLILMCKDHVNVAISDCFHKIGNKF